MILNIRFLVQYCTVQYVNQLCRYRSHLTIMVKPEEKSQTAPLSLPSEGRNLALPSAAGRKTRKASRTGAAAKLPIVRAQIRLPNELNEKMESAPATPVNLRREISRDIARDLSRDLSRQKLVNKLTEEENLKQVPKSVASMVRR